jgi:nicotinamide riboside kinase
MPNSLIVALMGAARTGKTTLAQQLSATLRSDGLSVATVPACGREAPDPSGPTPRIDELRDIAASQARCIAAAADSHAIVIADTTPLMTAVCSELALGDSALYPLALQIQRRCDVALLLAPGLACPDDTPSADGARPDHRWDERLRAVLQHAGLGYSVVGGVGPARLQGALAAVRHALGTSADEDLPNACARWQWVCDRCSDAECERHLLIATQSAGSARRAPR